MAATTAIAMLALIQYLFFVVMVGRARGRAGLPAPAVTGDEDFERAFRVQQNTLEQLIVFLPALFATAWFSWPLLAVALGVLFLVGRTLYFRGYVRDPATRGPGMLLTFGANLALLVAALVGALLAAF